MKNSRHVGGAGICVIGACHRDITLHLNAKTVSGRTNPARSVILSGGVAANIARAMAKKHDITVNFVGATAGDEVSVATHALPGINAQFACIDAPSASYTAILDIDGDLIIGAADTTLYERVRPDHVMPLLPEAPHSVIIDTNFPSATLLAVAQSLSADAVFFAVGTSVEKVNRLLPLLERLDGLVLNRAEASQLAGMSGDVGDLARDLASRLRGGGCALVSDGEGVAALVSGDFLVTKAPPKIQLANANGAGDVMAAAFFQQRLDRGNWATDTEAGLEDLLITALAAGANFATIKRK
jgi:pseudouridine kinase